MYFMRLHGDGDNILTSCKSKDTNRNLHPYENKLGIKPASLAQIDTINFTTIEWINPVQNFGILKYGDSAVIKFRFKNTGVHPLFLSRVQPSCGCTVAHYREEAIMPGEEDELTVIFNTIGQGSEVHKTVSVTTNTSNGVQHLLTFEGRVNR
ncbi:MAG: DUF1573 domain-containing protein [Bacteroidota bacterium]